MNAKKICRALVPVLAVAGAVAYAKPAHAELVLGAQGDASFQSHNGTTYAGVGGTAIAGFAADIGPVYLEPEAVFRYEGLPSDDLRALRIMGGFRFGLAMVVAPSVYGHVGYGNVSVPGTDSSDSVSVDAGAGLDFMPSDWCMLGLNVGYEGLLAPFEETVHGVFLGPHFVLWI